VLVGLIRNQCVLTAALG